MAVRKASPTELLQALKDSTKPLDSIKPRFKGMIYGPLGNGKTIEAMLLAQKITPADEQILFLDFMEGWVSVLNHPGLGNRTMRVEYQGLSQLETLAMALAAKVAPFDKVGTVIIDELSAIQKADLDIVIKAHNEAGKLEDADVAEWPQYNANAFRVRKAMVAILKLHVNCIIVSHMATKPNKNKIPVEQPSLAAATLQTVSEFLHIVARIQGDIKDVGGKPSYSHTVQVHPTVSVMAKSRVGGFDMKVSTKQFNDRIYEWMNAGATITDETKVVDDVDQLEKINGEIEETFDGFDAEDN